ncbi:hypothetical protein [Nostoc commune]|nr:hypothetical protein [Nostoc commune]
MLLVLNRFYNTKLAGIADTIACVCTKPDLLFLNYELLLPQQTVCKKL